MLVRICVLLFLVIGVTHAQDSSALRFEALPGGLHLLPAKANFQEARIGVLYYPNNGSLKVDVGNTIDLCALNFNSSESRLTLGIEFMAYALSNSFEEKRLQIDALDGFFGGNAVFSKKYSASTMFIKFRFIHNSAHLVDGSYLKNEQKWKNDFEPIPFTQDFGEFTFAHQKFFEKTLLKYYGGFSYTSHIRPAELKRWNLFTGFEFALPHLLGKVADREMNLFAAHHFTLGGFPKYMGGNHSMLGIKFGDWNDKGVVIYLSYYKGRNLFSEYFDERVSKFGIGFFIDFI